VQFRAPASTFAYLRERKLLAENQRDTNPIVPGVCPSSRDDTVVGAAVEFVAHYHWLGKENASTEETGAGIPAEAIPNRGG
jgi:hypothetical protein